MAGAWYIAGDLYHYLEERALKRLPAREFNVEQTRAWRAALDRFLERTGAALWVQHDLAGNAKLTKAPDYYE